MSFLLEALRLFGVLVKPSKVVWPFQSIKFLGLVLDFVAMIVRPLPKGLLLFWTSLGISFPGSPSLFPNSKDWSVNSPSWHRLLAVVASFSGTSSMPTPLLGTVV
jgi:hypothetical protein